MMWTALCAGAAIFVSLSCVAGVTRRASPDTGTAALKVLGASGMFALAIVTATAGTVGAAVVATVCGTVLTIDPLALTRRLAKRLPRADSSTVTPFQNATKPLI
jgi:ABC-type Fe3+-siderophore transport system permease subunit